MPTVGEVQQKVQRTLADLFGSVKVAANGMFVLNSGSAAVGVVVEPFMNDHVVVKVMSFVLAEFKITPEVYKWVATSGQAFEFGTFSVVEGDKPMLRLSHSLLGDFLDPEELRMAVMFVGLIADKTDDELKAKFGGKRMADN